MPVSSWGCASLRRSLTSRSPSCTCRVGGKEEEGVEGERRGGGKEDLWEEEEERGSRQERVRSQRGRVKGGYRDSESADQGMADQRIGPDAPERTLRNLPPKPCPSNPKPPHPPYACTHLLVGAAQCLVQLQQLAQVGGEHDELVGAVALLQQVFDHGQSHLHLVGVDLEGKGSSRGEAAELQGEKEKGGRGGSRVRGRGGV